MSLRVDVIKGADAGKGCEAPPGGRITIGRRESNALRIGGDDAVSREHLVIEVADDGMARAMDMESANGTRREGKKLPSRQWVRLKDGDQLELGNTVVKVRLGPGETGPEPAAAPLRIDRIAERAPAQRAEK